MTDIISKFIQENLELCEKATGGEWQVDFKKPDWYGVESTADMSDWICCADDSVCNRPTKDNAHFIANSRTALPKALKALEIAVTALQQYSYGEHTPASTDALTEIEELLK